MDKHKRTQTHTLTHIHNILCLHATLRFLSNLYVNEHFHLYAQFITIDFLSKCWYCFNKMCFFFIPCVKALLYSPEDKEVELLIIQGFQWPIVCMRTLVLVTLVCPPTPLFDFQEQKWEISLHLNPYFTLNF